MFSNIGTRIKNVAKYVYYIFMVLSIIAGIGGIISIISNNNMVGQDKILFIVYALCFSALGVCLSWFSTFLLYGFGELIDSNQKILKILEKNK